MTKNARVKRNTSSELQRIVDEGLAMAKDKSKFALAKAKNLKTGAPDVEGSSKDIKAYLRRVPVRRY